MWAIFLCVKVLNAEEVDTDPLRADKNMLSGKSSCSFRKNWSHYFRSISELVPMVLRAKSNECKSAQKLTISHSQIKIVFNNHLKMLKKM
jgi:hypothetical protein